MLGDLATEKQVQSLQESLGLNLPIYQQFYEYIKGLLRGDLGWSIYMKNPVLVAFMEHLGPTISLALIAQVLAILIALPLGILAAIKRGANTDLTIMGGVLLSTSIPSFWVGLLLIMLFSVQLNWLPSGGYQPISEGFFNHIKYLILPVLSLSLMQAALITR